MSFLTLPLMSFFYLTTYSLILFLSLTLAFVLLYYYFNLSIWSLLSHCPTIFFNNTNPIMTSLESNGIRFLPPETFNSTRNQGHEWQTHINTLSTNPVVTTAQTAILNNRQRSLLIHLSYSFLWLLHLFFCTIILIWVFDRC